MNEENVNKPPLGRYIAIALLFVIFFIGASYLVYRFTRSSGDVSTTTPTPNPTATSQPVAPVGSGLRYGTVLPAPQLAPTNPNNRLFIPQTTASQPIVRSNISGYRSVAQDGRGNLLFDNLTHDENFELQLARIESDKQLRLAQENNGHSLALQKVSTSSILDRQRDQNASSNQQQANLQASQLALAKEQSRVELARLQAQLAQAHLTAKRQPTAANQLKLSQLESTTKIALAQTQADSALKTQLLQLSFAEKQQLTQLAYQKATHDNDQTNALLAKQLASDLTRLEKADQHKQTIELAKLQSKIQQRLLLLNTYLNRDRGYSHQI